MSEHEEYEEYSQLIFKVRNAKRVLDLASTWQEKSTASRKLAQASAKLVNFLTNLDARVTLYPKEKN